MTELRKGFDAANDSLMAWLRAVPMMLLRVISQKQTKRFQLVTTSEGGVFPAKSPATAGRTLQHLQTSARATLPAEIEKLIPRLGETFCRRSVTPNALCRPVVGYYCSLLRSEPKMS